MRTTRHRTMDDRVYSGYVYDWTDTNKPPPNSGHEDRGNNSFVGTYKTCDDNNNLGAAKAIANGTVIFSDCLLTKWTRTMTPGLITAVNKIGSNNYSGIQQGDMIGGAPGVPLKPSPLICTNGNEMVLLMKAYARMNESALMGGESLATLGQTIAMLRSPFKGASDLLSRMIKSRASKLGKTSVSVAKATANTWLEYRYGWKPLILDIDTIIKTAHKERANCERRLVARAGDKQTHTELVSWTAGPGTGNHTGSRKLVSTLSCNVGVMYDVISRNTREQLEAILGFRPRDLPATLWELTPYSFVVDWFVNVGDWIQAITPVPGISVRGHWVTQCRLDRTTCSDILIDPSALKTGWHGTLGSDEVIYSTFQRVCNQQLTFVPTLKAKGLSTLHQADAMALLVKPIIGDLKIFRH